ncbi:hypothetical protein ABPG74_002069 [Tetrahymena malaccensis]
MRILIVNGYQKTREGFQKFSDFQYNIVKIMQEQKELVDTETEYLIRDKDNVEDFLYEIESSYLKKEAASNFDSLDIIFITGDANVRPWSRSMKKILTLIRMSMKANKYLFASSFAMQAVVFLCASNLESNIEVINGQGNGGKLSDMHNLPIRLQDVKHYHYFLENTTGDLYGFNYESNEWVPKGNCGLHFRRSAQEFQSIGKYILKAPIYKATSQNVQIILPIKSNKNEEVCSIKKVYYHHWLFQGMDTEFLVELKNSWDIHSFSFTNPEKTFQILAECERGPLVIQCLNIICTLFTVNSKYPNTLLPIQNFILNTLKYIKSDNKKNQVSIQSLIHTHKLSSVEEILKKQRQKQNKTLMLMKERSSKLGFYHANIEQKDQNQDGMIENDYIKYPDMFSSDEFRHVGFSAKKDHVPDIVKQNAVVNSKVKIRNKITLHVQQDQDKKLKQKSKSVHLNINNLPKKILFNENDFNSENNFFENDQEAMALKDQIQIQEYGKSNVRQFLHPSIPSEYTQGEPLWVPGMLSNPQNKIKRGIHIRSPSDSQLSTARSKTKSVQNQNTLYKSFVKPGKFFGETQGSVFSQQPYITLEQIQKIEQKENDKRIIAHRIFKTGSKRMFEPFPSQLISGNDRHIHNFIQKYREEKREKWVSQQNFKLI